MPEYPYRCAQCETRWLELRSTSELADETECPACGLKTSEQDYQAKNIVGYVSVEGDWSNGKQIVQLHPNHPDKMVTSKTQMEKVYRKHGISLDTGHFISKEAQVAATVPIKRRLSSSKETNAVGGVREEN